MATKYYSTIEGLLLELDNYQQFTQSIANVVRLLKMTEEDRSFAFLV